MKNCLLKSIAFAISGSFILGIGSCKKDSPSNYVNDYQPTLKEPAKTVYSGDYYPIKPQNSWTLQGSETITGSASTSGISTPVDETLDIDDYTYVGDQISLELPSGTYSVYPIYQGNGAVSYYQVTDTSIYQRAYASSSYSDPAEVKNSIFLKRNLVVGDSWQTQPEVDMSQMLSADELSGTTATMSVTCKVFVLGKENVSWNNTSVETISIEERAEESGIININDVGMTGELNFNLKMDLFLNLLKDVGPVKETVTMHTTMNGNLNFFGENITMSANEDADGTVTLAAYTANSAVVGKKATENKSIDFSKNTAIVNIIKKAMASVKKIQLLK